jgi:gluconokinase
VVIVLMGPAGSGKSTVGERLARAAGWDFLEGDDYHPAHNLAAMRAGRALTDAERAPWLAALTREIAARLESGRGAVLACSALKRAYREALVPPGEAARVRFVYLSAPAAVLERRLAARTGHFFGPEGLPGQIEALEAPEADEGILRLDATRPVEVLVEEIRERLGV